MAVAPAIDAQGQIKVLTGDGITADKVIAWSILLVVFVVMTDIPVMQPIGAGLAILLLVSVTLKYGPSAFGNVSTFNTVKLPQEVHRP